MDYKSSRENSFCSQTSIYEQLALMAKTCCCITRPLFSSVGFVSSSGHPPLPFFVPSLQFLLSTTNNPILYAHTNHFYSCLGWCTIKPMRILSGHFMKSDSTKVKVWYLEKKKKKNKQKSTVNHLLKDSLVWPFL